MSTSEWLHEQWDRYICWRTSLKYQTGKSLKRARWNQGVIVLLSVKSSYTCPALYKVPSMPSVRKKRAQSKQSYLRKKENKREASRTKYRENPDKQRAASQASKDPDKKRAASRASYWRNPDKKRAASRASYRRDPESKRASSRASSHTRY